MTVRSQEDVVPGSTNTLLKNVSENMITNPRFITALGVRSTSPRVIQAQDRAEAETNTRPTAASTLVSPSGARKPHQQSESQDQSRGK